MSNPKQDLLLNAAVAYVKSMMGFNVCQTENKVIVEIRIGSDKVLNIDLSHISAFNDISLEGGELKIKPVPAAKTPEVLYRVMEKMYSTDDLFHGVFDSRDKAEKAIQDNNSVAALLLTEFEVQQIQLNRWVEHVL